MAFNPPAKQIRTADVGVKYHVGIGYDSTGTGAAPDHIYGYMLEPGSAFVETTDLHARQTLVSYSSPSLIDRDFVNYPRVTDGDFSGGLMQSIFIDPRRYYDSDLDTEYPGILRIRPAPVLTSTTAADTTTQMVAWNGGFFASGATTIQALYAGATSANAYTTVTPSGPFLDTDGKYLYASNGTTVVRTDLSTNANVCTTVQGTTAFQQMWVVNLGSIGYWLYYFGADNNLYKIDLSNPAAFPIASANHVQVAMGANPLKVVDIAPYQTGVAVLTQDPNNYPVGCDLWYHDGSNFTHIVRLDGYKTTGMCSCLGDLYVALNPPASGIPRLVRVTPGQVSVVVAYGISDSGSTSTNQTAQPRSSGGRVYWWVGDNFSVISRNRVIEFDPAANSVRATTLAIASSSTAGGDPHGGPATITSLSGGPVAGKIRQIAAIDRQVGTFATLSGNFNFVTTGGFTLTAGASGYYTPSASYGISRNWMVSSRFDFNTPSVDKLLKRVTISHSALNAGESVKVLAFIDKNPKDFGTNATQGTGAGQYDATITNSTTGSKQTVLSLPTSTVGKSLYVAIQLAPGTSAITTPVVYYFSVECGVPWSWQFTVNCSSRRNTADQQDDPQALRGIDLYGLLHDVWEGTLPVTFYHPNGVSYTAVVESLKFSDPNPLYMARGSQSKDYEATCEVVLRQASI